ncbi:hypothetical protein R50073_48810 [Maricurvus nonylphenolicus]
MPRVAFYKPPQGEINPFYKTVFLKGFFRVVRAGGIKAALIADPGAEKVTVNMDKLDRYLFHRDSSFFI